MGYASAYSLIAAPRFPQRSRRGSRILAIFKPPRLQSHCRDGQPFCRVEVNTSRTVVADPVSNEDVRQRAILLVLALSIACSAGPLPTPPPGPGVPRPDARRTRSVDPVVFPEAFSLSLTQEFGYAPMRYCTLEVAIYQPFPRVALECLHQNGVVTRAGRDLRAEESEQMFKFASGADLFQGGHSGEDLTPGDGTLETLKVRAGETGRAVVLITSYNATFEDNAARRELLRLLKAFEDELSKQLKRST